MGWTKRLLILAALVLTSLVPASAQAPKRVALVIANAAYASANVLTNPTNDAAIVTAALRRAGFQTVDAKNNLGIASFQRALRDFQARADGAQIALIYYAGHGIEGNGKNWLIPTDAVLNSERDLDYEAINLDLVLSSVSGADLRVVILDACRNNPLGRNWRRGARAVSRGLGGVDADDVLVIYAAAPGETASDGSGANSPFATALAQRLPQPDLPIQLLGGAVRDDVLRTTGGVQRPFVSASITGTPFYLVPRVQGVSQAPQPSQPTMDAATLEALTWQGALGANSVTAFEDYLRQYPQGRFRVQAQQNIARLQAPASTPAVAVQAPQVARPAPATSTASPGSAFRDCGDCPEMVTIPAGSFVMGKPSGETAYQGYAGAEEPQRTVSLRAFAAGKTEVTFDQWSACVNDGGCSGYAPGDQGYGRGNRPVINVSWEDAKRYVQWLSNKTGQSYRLLTEAEWEYAARAGTTSAFPWGDVADHANANYGTDACCNGLASGRDQWVNTAPVGSFPANRFGLYDMHGNVWEWVEDCWHDNYAGAPSDGGAWTTGSCDRRVFRGGSWNDFPTRLRSAYRGWGAPSYRGNYLGFRLARTL